MFSRNPLIVGPDLYSQLKIDVNNPREIGSDLVANAVAAFEKSGGNCIVVDFGTALTFTTISKQGKILGVAIAPGLKTALNTLSEGTAKLPEVPLQVPKSVLGQNTIHAMQAGTLIGFSGLVQTLISRIKQEVNSDCRVIATGGLASILDPDHSQFDQVEPNLTLEGLRLIQETIS
jgi:type III pantothenate kinase